MKTALLFGATGLIGTEVLKYLINDPRYDKIIVFSRKPLEIQSEKIQTRIADFEKLYLLDPLIHGDDVFCCLGTTRRKAGSQTAFRKIDHDLVVDIASHASKNGVKNFAVISSVGANANSGNFYLKTKGEMERDVKALHFQGVHILRPSILTGDRKEFRMGEKFGIGAMSLLSPLMMGGLKKYKPIHAETVAKAMIALVNSENKQRVYESDELQKLGR